MPCKEHFFRLPGFIPIEKTVSEEKIETEMFTDDKHVVMATVHMTH